MTYNDNNLTLEQKLTKITLLRYQLLEIEISQKQHKEKVNGNE